MIFSAILWVFVNLYLMSKVKVKGLAFIVWTLVVLYPLFTHFLLGV